jgi:hypothetical protein
MAILSGTERIDELLLDSVELAATEEAAAQRQTTRRTRKRDKK